MVRRVTDGCATVPAHRIAVLYGAAEPYARLLAEHLAAAGIASNGAGVRPTIERTLARPLLDLLALPDHGWRRDEVLAVLASAPVRDAGRAPGARRALGPRSRGRPAWSAATTGTPGWPRTRREERDAAEVERTPRRRAEGLIARRERDADAADALRTFVADLRGRLDAGASLGCVARAGGLGCRHVPGTGRRPRASRGCRRTRPGQPRRSARSCPGWPGWAPSRPPPT